MSTASSAAADLWRSLGVELAIFVVTLSFALLIRGFSSQRAGGGGKQCSAVARQQKVVYSPSSQRSAEPIRKTVSAKQEASPCIRRIAHEAAAKAVPTASSQFRAAHCKARYQIIDEVVEGMREQQSMKFASRALGSYEELRTRLREDGVRLSEAARSAQYTALDFYATIVHCAIRAGRQHLVEAIIEDMADQGVARPLAFYESTMKQLAGQKQYHLALSVFDRLSADGLQPSAVTCSCLIGFAAEVGELQRSVSFFERLSSMTTPSIRAYMTVLRVHAKRQDWPSSVDILKDMQRRNVPLDSLALNVALATGVAVDQVEAVAEMIAEADTHTPPISDVVSYNTLIKGYAQRADPNGALQALDGMRKRGLAPNAISFNTAMDAAVRGGRAADAWRLLGELRDAGLQPDKYTCSILVKGLEKTPASDRVRAELERMCGVTAATPSRSTRSIGRSDSDPFALLVATVPVVA